MTVCIYVRSILSSLFHVTHVSVVVRRYEAQLSHLRSCKLAPLPDTHTVAQSYGVISKVWFEYARLPVFSEKFAVDRNIYSLPLEMIRTQMCLGNKADIHTFLLICRCVY